MLLAPSEQNDPRYERESPRCPSWASWDAHEAAEVQITAAVLMRRHLGSVGQTEAAWHFAQLKAVKPTSVVAPPNACRREVGKFVGSDSI